LAPGPAIRLRSIGLRLLVLAACVTSRESATLSIPEESPVATTVSTSDLDVAALTRVARAAESSGGDVIDAAQVYRRIAERQPSSAGPRIELGRLLLKRGDVEGADRSFREALTLEPANVEASIGLGQVLLAREQHAQAGELFGRIASGHPNNVKALNGWGLALDGLRRHDEAQPHYRRALQIDPGEATVRNNLGLSLALSGRRDEAVAILEKLANEPGAIPRYRENLAFARSLRSAPSAGQGRGL
jgi:Flp pilus assembly protein TadD